MIPRTRLGVIGWPVAHSRSPAMHNAALAATGRHDWRYSLLPIPPELFAETVRALPGRGFRGVNVTIPHKGAALAVADHATAAAGAIGAANTLVFQDGRVEAANTDAPALIDALPVPVRGARVLVLGAGGSARAAVWAIQQAGAGEVRVWNRTAERARRLTAALGGTPVAAPAPAVRDGEILINCTSAGLASGEEQFKSLPIRADAVTDLGCVIDFVYRSEDTPLIAAARSAGVPAVDGLELLARQGALSYTLFTGDEAPIEVMRAAARTGDRQVVS